MKNINKAINEFEQMMEQHVSKFNYPAKFFPGFKENQKPEINKNGDLLFMFEDFFQSIPDGEYNYLPTLEKELNSLTSIVELRKIRMSIIGQVYIKKDSNEVKIGYGYLFLNEQYGIKDLKDLTDKDVNEVQQNIFESIKPLYKEKLTDIIECYKKVMGIDNELTYSFNYRP